jgi:hypothetical protein
MKNTKINLKLFKALFIDKNPELFQLIKKMDLFSRAMSKTRYDSSQIEKNGWSILENKYIEEIDNQIKKNRDEYPVRSWEFTTERKNQVAQELRLHVKTFFYNASRDKNFNMHRIKTDFVNKNDEQGWDVVSAIGPPYLDLDNPANNKLFWNGKEVDEELISEFIKITENTNTKSRRDVQIRLLDFNFGVSAKESIPVKFLLHFINNNHRNKNIQDIIKKPIPDILDYIDLTIQAVANKNREYNKGDWTRVIEYHSPKFALKLIPRFKHYLDEQREE